MHDAPALFELLQAAPARSAEIIKRFALDDLSIEALGELYGVDRTRAERLVFRALRDVETGGARALDDNTEAREVDALFGRASSPVGDSLRALEADLRRERESVRRLLAEAALAWERSPARQREEWLRRLAIVVVLALSAFFYWREQNKPKPPPERRPTVIPGIQQP
jgi:hypothetical protein